MSWERGHVVGPVAPEQRLRERLRTAHWALVMMAVALLVFLVQLLGAREAQFSAEARLRNLVHEREDCRTAWADCAALCLVQAGIEGEVDYE